MAISNVSNGKQTEVTKSASTKKKGLYSREISISETEDIHPYLTLNATERDGQLGFGSVAIMTRFGMPLIIDSITIKRDKDGDVGVSMPYKVKANKDEGGSGMLIDVDGFSGYGIKGARRYDNIVKGDGAFEAMRCIASAYDSCVSCENMKQTKRGSDYLGCKAEAGKVQWTAVEGCMTCSCHEDRVEQAATKKDAMAVASELTDLVGSVVDAL